MSITDQLLAFVSSELLNDNVTLGAHDMMLADGLVDSVGLMRFVAYVEATFGCQVPLEDIVLENFRSIDAVVAYLGRLGVAQATA